MNCKLHSDREAVAGCVSCGGLVCADCDVPIAGKHHCKACLAHATSARGGPTLIERAEPAMAQRAPQPLRRSRSDAVLGGVCGGLAQYLGMDSALVRLLAVVSMLTVLSCIVYVLAWILIPLNRNEERVWS